MDARELEWRQAALASLKGRSFDEALMATTSEGLPLEPLYTERHASRAAPPVRPPKRPAIAQRFDVRGSTVSLSDAAMAGVDALWLRAELPAELDAALAGVDLQKTALLLDAGTNAPQLAKHASSKLGARKLSALFDPFGSALRRWGLDVPLEGALDAAGALVREADPGGKALAISPADVLEAGGHGALAIGYALAGTVELFRRLEARDVPPAEVARQLAYVVAPGLDVFYGIAMLRALRLGWTKVLSPAGIAALEPTLIGTTTERALSELDRPNNMVRVSLETFALLVGGADVVAPRAFDDVHTSSPLGHRLAKNTALVLARESHLGDVADAAAGSYYVEALTMQLARAGWDEMRAIEREGGLLSSLQAGRFQHRVEAAKAARAREVATRRRVVVGANDFVDASDPISSEATPSDAAEHTRVWPIVALVPSRDAEPFEALRARARIGGKARGARIVLVGDASKARAREAFTRRFLEAAGFIVTDVDSDIVVVCGVDAAYATSGLEQVRAAKAAGAKAIVLAGKPGALQADLDAAGLTHSIHAGSDLVAVASSLFDRLGVPR